MGESVTEKINRIFGIDDSYKAPSKIMEILFDRERREDVFRQFVADPVLNCTEKDVFHEYFQDEHADRKTKKQDFTPRSVADLLARVTDGGLESATTYDGCAGTGGLTIAKWQSDRIKHSPFDYKPSWYFYHCEEMSDRAIPFLLFNLLFRGMNAVVVHCDVLTRKSKGAFFIQNDHDDFMHFSALNVLPYTDFTADELDVTWDDDLIPYDDLIESKEIPAHVINPTEYDAVSAETKFLHLLCGIDGEVS
ncbi:N-6 DNA methylase [Bacillus altitudinis]|uniref:N-6 DNA methylase n=1 Tax=Bacillus altitudinis TaxID=293387 RepID=UPI00227E9E98|nr:N-6 DNA methylase [Bacillus altitudinis]MCY7439419.1 N-6 DNA methylase [Bacillus altitudinis]MEC1142457.1 N-6 DNA methylase [Bacillus altitudinis]